MTSPQFIFLVIAAGAGGFMVMAVRDVVLGHVGRDTREAVVLALLSGVITLAFVIILAVSLWKGSTG